MIQFACPTKRPMNGARLLLVAANVLCIRTNGGDARPANGSRVARAITVC